MGKNTERTNAHQDVIAETLTNRLSGRGHALFLEVLIYNEL